MYIEILSADFYDFPSEHFKPSIFCFKSLFFVEYERHLAPLSLLCCMLKHLNSFILSLFSSYSSVYLLSSVLHVSKIEQPTNNTQNKINNNSFSFIISRDTSSFKKFFLIIGLYYSTFLKPKDFFSLTDSFLIKDIKQVIKHLDCSKDISHCSMFIIIGN